MGRSDYEGDGMSGPAMKQQFETIRKRRYLRPTLVARGRLQAVTGEDSLGTPILSDDEV